MPHDTHVPLFVGTRPTPRLPCALCRACLPPSCLCLAPLQMLLPLVAGLPPNHRLCVAAAAPVLPSAHPLLNPIHQPSRTSDSLGLFHTFLEPCLYRPGCPGAPAHATWSGHTHAPQRTRHVWLAVFADRIPVPLFPMFQCNRRPIAGYTPVGRAGRCKCISPYIETGRRWGGRKLRELQQGSKCAG